MGVQQPAPDAYYACMYIGQIVRRYQLCYIPPGFWPRLIARLILFPVRTLFKGQVMKGIFLCAVGFWYICRIQSLKSDIYGLVECSLSGPM